MNQILNNIFDDESIEAIKNADNNGSGPRTTPMPDEVIEMEQEIPQTMQETTSSEDTSLLKRQLETKIQEQANRITTLINSQNQMIKEFNDVLAEVKRLKARPVSVAPQVNSAPASAPEPVKDPNKQQNGAAEGLNPEEFSVEKHFYYGK
jgi:predicted nuclease with TOPRIM domain